MDEKYIHIGDHISITKNGQISLFGICIGDTEQIASSKLDNYGIYYEYDKQNHYIQSEYYFDRFVIFDNAIRHADLTIGFHFDKNCICESIYICNNGTSVFSETGLRWMADAIELFDSSRTFQHEYGQVSKSGIIKVFRGGNEFAYIHLGDGFFISFINKEEYKRRLGLDKFLPSSVNNNKQ